MVTVLDHRTPPDADVIAINQCDDPPVVMLAAEVRRVAQVVTAIAMRVHRDDRVDGLSRRLASSIAFVSVRPTSPFAKVLFSVR
jgi:hypothetical protein